ncbi:MAG: hypothetical protein OXC63_14605 [Aestuariivita sp.]|nr:hypothetical protein [Aestuariivita sp.]MCY4347435.1 hypothetical protein [Aestuariivita sp.]
MVLGNLIRLACGAFRIDGGTLFAITNHCESEAFRLDKALKKYAEMGYDKMPTALTELAKVGEVKGVKLLAATPIG